jgi:hypothetical protein
LANGLNIWSVQAAVRLSDLRTLVLAEQKNTTSPWYADGIPVSYLRDGYCAAALSELIRFMSQQGFVDKLLKIYDSHTGDEAALATKLDIDPELPDDYVYEPFFSYSAACDPRGYVNPRANQKSTNRPSFRRFFAITPALPR